MHGVTDVRQGKPGEAYSTATKVLAFGEQRPAEFVPGTELLAGDTGNQDDDASNDDGNEDGEAASEEQSDESGSEAGAMDAEADEWESDHGSSADEDEDDAAGVSWSPSTRQTSSPCLYVGNLFYCGRPQFKSPASWWLGCSQVSN